MPNETDVKAASMKTKRLGWREVRKMLESDGWEIKSQVGSHIHYQHPAKPGKVTIVNGQNPIPPGTLRSIFRQAGLEWPPK